MEKEKAWLLVMNEEGEPNTTTWSDNFSCVAWKVFCYYVIIIKRFLKGNGTLFNLTEELLIWERTWWMGLEGWNRND